MCTDPIDIDVFDIPNMLVNFIKSNYNEDYDLIVVDAHSGYKSLFIKPGKNIYNLICQICSAEKVTELYKYEVRNSNYIICINITKGSLVGVFEYSDENKLIQVSEKPINFDDKPIKKKQHYVPVLYLESFIQNQGKLSCFNVEENRAFTSSAEKICNEHLLYEAEGTAANFTEDLLSELEGKYKAKFNSLDKKIKNHDINSEDRKSIFNYITLQFWRHPTLINKVESIWKKMVPAFSKKMSMLTLIGDYGVPSELASFLLETHQLRVYNTTETRFVSSDMPVIFIPNIICIQNADKECDDYGILTYSNYVFPYNKNACFVLEYQPEDTHTVYLDANEELKKIYLEYAALSGARFYFGENLSESDKSLISLYYCEQGFENIDIRKIYCYIEEYVSGGKSYLRLRDKTSNKIIDFAGVNYDEKHLKRFLLVAKANPKFMPTVFDRFGQDVVTVIGIYLKESKLTITISLDYVMSGYLFE